MMPKLADRFDSFVLAIDLQERLLAAFDEPVRQELERNAAILLRGAGVLGVPVVATEQYPRGLGPTVASVRQAWAPGTQAFEKVDFSCLACSGVLQAIGALERTTAVLCGAEAHICVLQTAHALLERGYSVHVCADACASRRRFNAEVAFDRLRAMGATVTVVESVLFEWLGAAGTEEFRAISRLVR